MPICERDPWRDQYFENIACPDDVNVPTDDIDAWGWYPAHNWIYDKLAIAKSQGFSCGPHGAAPPEYPVFSKPITNLKGMGTGSCVIHSAKDMEARSTPGHFWLPFFTGAHVSTDCVVVKGRVQWLRHATGVPWTEGMFKYWTLHTEDIPELANTLRTWVAKNMGGYTGMLNFETIGGNIIEAHLRFADQWCDMNGAGWIEAVVRLYAEGIWQYTDDVREEGFSIPLFARHNGNFRHPPEDMQQRIRAMPDISSLQITFYEARDAEAHAMPPGGFRLALVNAWSLQAGRSAIAELAKCFPAEQLLRS